MLHARIVIGSAITAVVLLIGWLVTYLPQMESCVISMTPEFHLRLFEGSVWFSSHVVPYRGSLIQLDGTPPMVTFRSVDLPGLYYRYVVTTDFHFWTLRVSLLYAVLLVPLPFLIWLLRQQSVDQTKVRSAAVEHIE